MSSLVGHWLSVKHCCHFHNAVIFSVLAEHLITMKVPPLRRGKFLVSSCAFPNGNALPLGLYQTQNHFGAPLPQLHALRSGALAGYV